MSRIEYRMNIKLVDNSAVDTRQVRRRRAMGKNWGVNPRPAFSSSKYMPHQGHRECERRMRQLEKARAA